MAILVDLAEEDEVDVVATREEEEEEELAVVAVGLRLEMLVAIPIRNITPSASRYSYNNRKPPHNH